MAWMPAFVGVVPAAAEEPLLRAVYYDASYPSAWVSGMAVRDGLSAAGYDVLDANQLQQWMNARITDGRRSVVVFAKDVVPDTVAASAASNAMIRRYLNKGGKIVWFGDIPLYYQGHANGSLTTWGTAGAVSTLGFNAASGTWDLDQPVTITTDGTTWGLQQAWGSQRPTAAGGLRALARNALNQPAGWVRHYHEKDTFRGFVRFHDRPGTPSVADVRALAEYAPAVLLGDDVVDNIVLTFHYPWYGNPGTSGNWVHWNDAGYTPPRSWTANYLPSYPDSAWNPAVQLYDSKAVDLLRWQDRGMARAGVDIAAASWWGIGTFEDAAFSKAIRVAKSVQWCIYYELESSGDPTPQKIHDDLKYVIDLYTPSRNYARIDGKPLVAIFAASGSAAADRWRQGKAMLTAEGYNVYLNADVADVSAATAPDPWDAVHHYNPLAYQSLTAGPLNADDSASVAPGFWKIGESVWLARSLAQFTSAWANVTANHENSRFKLLETWNELHEGTQIEPGQEVVPDVVNGFSPAGYDYGYDFVDAVAPMAHVLRWQSEGHRPIAPARREAEEMVWETGTSDEGATAWRISTGGARIGFGIEVPDPLADAWIVVRARAVQVGALAGWPELVVYWDDGVAAQWTVKQTTFREYVAAGPLPSGIHRLEVSLANDPGGTANVDLVVDFAEVYDPASDGDYDDDGVGDAADVCPTNPDPGQEDSDGDGVGDACDACPATIPGVGVDFAGCPPAMRGDLDFDGDSDQTDYGIFQACYTPTGEAVAPPCGDADLNEDSVVNGGDLQEMLDCMTGPGVPAGC